MRLMSIIAMICLLFCMSTTGMAQNDENAPDTLTLQTAKALPDNRIAVDINFFNDQPLAALTIPLQIAGAGLKIDTVLFTDSRIDYLRIKPVTITEDRRSVVFGAICMTEAYIAAGSGPVATLILSSADKKPITECGVDTTTISPANILFTKPDSKSFIPVVNMGTIMVSKPAAADSSKQQ